MYYRRVFTAFFGLVMILHTATFAADEPLVTPVAYLIFYEYGEVDLTPEAHQIVDIIADNLSKNLELRAEILGHDDTSLPSDLNLALSYRRAKEVAAALVARGIDSDRIYLMPLGDDELLVPTGRGVREPQNRNVEIDLVSQSSPLSRKGLRVYKP